MGGSSGIGFMLAEFLARGGVKVGVAARRTEALEALKEMYPSQVEYMSIDITKPDAVERLETLIGLVGGMDLYLHVAGTGVENLSLEPVAEVNVLRTNVEGFARCLCTAYRWMRSHGVKGQIAAVTSVAGTNGLGRLTAYSASKAFGQTYLRALEQLSNAEKSGICFTDIRPGWVRTPLLTPGVKYPMEMDVRYAARCILKAIVRRRRVAVIDWRWNIVVGLWRLIPNCLWVRLDIPVSTPDQPLPAPKENAPVTGGDGLWPLPPSNGNSAD